MIEEESSERMFRIILLSNKIVSRILQPLLFAALKSSFIKIPHFFAKNT